ncbi:MAG: YutD family protein [Turicibacter sp.]
MSKFSYKVIKEYMIEYEQEVFDHKMTEVLDKYDVLVGDFSGGQLRLKGFYYNERKNVPLELKCLTIPEYITEFCVYGCPYYVLEKIKFPHNPSEQKNSVEVLVQAPVESQIEPVVGEESKVEEVLVPDSSNIEE